jgi:hypothetical protein
MSTGQNVTYQITVKGKLEPRWSDWFDGILITSYQNDQGLSETILTGPLDQAALHGILLKIRNLNLELISVRQTRSKAHEENRSSI